MPVVAACLVSGLPNSCAPIFRTMLLLRVLVLLLLLIVLPPVVLDRLLSGRKSKTRTRFLLFAPSAVMLLWCAFVLFFPGATWATTLFLFFLLAFCLPEFLFMLFVSLGRLLPSKILRNVFTIIGAVLAVLVLYVAIIGFWDSNRRFRVVEHRVVVPRLPDSFNGFRICQFSDFHLGSFCGDTAFVARVCDSINATRADLIVFTGDLVNQHSCEADPYRSLLASLHSPHGVVSILGNHDYMIYARQSRENQVRDIQRLCNLEKEAGWVLLRNENLLLSNGTDTIALLGSENSGRTPFPDRGDLGKTLRGVPEGMTKILLTHDPAQWEKSVVPDTDIDLTLSGHTHGLQIDFPFFHPCKLVHKHGAGFYNSGDRLLFVNTGIGAALIPFRCGVWPEINVLVLSNH